MSDPTKTPETETTTEQPPKAKRYHDACGRPLAEHELFLAVDAPAEVLQAAINKHNADLAAANVEKADEAE